MALERRASESGAPLDAAAVVRALVDVLGEPLVALLAGADSTRVVEEWGGGEKLPSSDVERRLRVALEASELLLRYDDAVTVRSWWVGMNPELGDEAPALVLAQRPDYVLDAAYCYLAQ
jgi:hypothetical protein